MAIPDIQELPAEYRHLLDLAQERFRIEVLLLERLKGGRTGALLYLISVAPQASHQLRHLILKLDRIPPRAEADEIEKHKQAQDLAPPAFARQHIAELVYELKEDGLIAVFYAIAGQSLLQFRPIAHHTRRSQLETIFRTTSDLLLNHWNTPQTFDRAIHPQVLLERWLDYRLQPDAGIARFLEEFCHIRADTPGLLIQGEAYPNPLAFGRNRAMWDKTRLIDVLTGCQHGDLNTRNVLVRFAPNGQDLDGYFLIDFALFRAEMPLLFDPHYLEMSYLIDELEQSGLESCINLVTHFASEDTPDPQHVPVRLAGACAVLNAGRRAFGEWVESAHATLSDDLWAQFWLAGAAAGLSFCNKQACQERERVVGLVYAAAHLKRFCSQFGLCSPQEVKLLYDGRRAGQPLRPAEYEMAATTVSSQEHVPPELATPFAGRPRRRRTTARLELSLLGTVAIILDGEEVSAQVPAKCQAVLGHLAVTGRTHSREKLAGLLWGDKPDSRAKANLRKSLSILGQMFEDALIVTRQTVAFNRASDYWLDVEAFESALAQQEPAPENLDSLREAVALYRGEFLEGFSVRQALEFEEWVLQERERLRQAVIQALQRLSEACARQGDYAAAIEYTNRLLALEPWQEEAHRQLMTLLARSGQQSAALAQYETCRRILAEALGVEPMPETQALYQGLKTRREGAPHNLPPQTTPFVGRQAELTQIAHHLDQTDCRLLTLIGAGGIGKTRLALQAAGQALNAFADGVYFVPLAGISSSEFLVPTIGEAIGSPLSGEADPRRQLLRHLKQKEMLLVLDNFEHLLSSPGGDCSGRDLVREMVATAPKLKLLVTSRERLNLQAEWLLTLHGLSYPSEETPDGDETFEAMELFAQEARRVRPDFNLRAEWSHIVRICRLLDGMPLGIELAATWASLMPCTEIAQELSQGLDLLAATLHDVPARHRSLEAVFDHSWQLLSEPERTAFKNLSVFQGGFDRQAAKQVAGASLSTLAVLVNKSLLRVVSPGRYDMLEPIKQYAAAKLAETPAMHEQVQNRHCDYYAAFLKRWDSAIMTEAAQPHAIVEITTDIDNIRLGWGRAASQGNLEAVATSQESLWSFYEIRGWFQEGDEAFQKAIAGTMQTHGEMDELAGKVREALGQLLVRRGWFCWRLGRYRKSKEVLRQSLACFRHAAPQTQGEVGFAFSQLGFVEWYMGNYFEAKSLLQESLAIGKEARGWFLTVSFAGLSHVARSLGDYAESKKWCQKGAALCRERNERRGEVFHLINLAWTANAMGDYAEAEQWLQQTLVVHSEINDRALLARSLTQLGTAAYLKGDYAEAKQRHLESVNLSRESSERWHMALALIGLGYAACALGEYEASSWHFREALQTAVDIESRWMAVDALGGLATLLTAYDPGEAAAEQAVELLAFVLQHPSSSQEAKDRATTLLTELEDRLSPAAMTAALARGEAGDLSDIADPYLLASETRSDRLR